MDRARLRTFLLGGAAGMLAGVLLAPRSGRELRGSLSDRAGEARERGRESFFERREGMRERRAAFREGRGRTSARQAPSEEEAPRLREISVHPEDPETSAPGPVGGSATEAERSEELRRKVRETRERLRGKQDPGPRA